MINYLIGERVFVNRPFGVAVYLMVELDPLIIELH